MTEHTKCPNCESTELELRTDFHTMCSKCGYVFPEAEANPDDETPRLSLVDPSEADTLVMNESDIAGDIADVKKENADGDA